MHPTDFIETLTVLADNCSTLHGQPVVNDPAIHYFRIEKVFSTGHLQLTILDDETREESQCLIVSPVLLGHFTLDMRNTIDTLCRRGKDVLAQEYERVFNLPDPDCTEEPNT